MSRLVDLDNGVIKIVPETLLIEPFKTIWESDKNKEKIEATNKIKYIWYYIDFSSPFYQQNEEERHKLILETVLNDKKFKVTKDIEQGIDIYKKITTTPSMKLFEAVQKSITKMERFFEEVEYNESNIKTIQAAIIAMPSMQESVQQALENCKKEQSSSLRVRGNAKPGLFEDLDLNE